METPPKRETRNGPFRFTLRELLIALALLSVVFAVTPYWHQRALVTRFPYIDQPESDYDLSIGANIYQHYTPLLAIFFSIALGALVYSLSRRSNKKAFCEGLPLAVPLLFLPYPLAPAFFLITAGLVSVAAILVTLGFGLVKQRHWYGFCGTYNLIWFILLWSWCIDHVRAYGM